MRLDKFLKVSRLIKRRTVANEVSDMGRVLVNNNPAKSAKQIKENDIITIEYANRVVKFVSACRRLILILTFVTNEPFSEIMTFQNTLLKYREHNKRR